MQIFLGQYPPCLQTSYFQTSQYMYTLSENRGRQVREVLNLAFSQNTFKFNLDLGSAVKCVPPCRAVTVLDWKNIMMCNSCHSQCFHENRLGWSASSHNVWELCANILKQAVSLNFAMSWVKVSRIKYLRNKNHTMR